jgi:PIN domain nuclease of toxin-antitoxin system
LILDTTYLLPLARITIEVDLLEAIIKGGTNLKLEDATVSLISIFELQAKAAKLMVPAEFVVKAVEAIFNAFKVEPFYKPQIIETSYKLKKLIPDYIDCVIAATAITLKEHLITEDSLILSNAKAMKKEYGIEVFSFKDVVKR